MGKIKISKMIFNFKYLIAVVLLSYLKNLRIQHSVTYLFSELIL